MIPDDCERAHEHFARHRAESGRGDPHFMPFAPDDPSGPDGLDVGSLSRALSEPGWQRWFVAVTENDDIVGHVNLKAGRLRAGLHRCELGIGIERPYRGAGLGRRLMESAIDFARQQEALTWVDLRVFSHNVNARRLYESVGFSEVGTLIDRFRIEADEIDDVIMTLRVD